MGWDDQDLIFTALAASELTRKSFAECIVRVSERNVEQWITGLATIPMETRRELERFMALSPTERRAYVNISTAVVGEPEGAPEAEEQDP